MTKSWEARVAGESLVAHGASRGDPFAKTRISPRSGRKRMTVYRYIARQQEHHQKQTFEQRISRAARASRRRFRRKVSFSVTVQCRPLRGLIVVVRFPHGLRRGLQDRRPLRGLAQDEVLGLESNVPVGG